MTIQLSDLTAEDRAELAKLVAAQIAPAPAPAAPATGGGTVPNVDLSQFLGLASMTEESKKQLTDWMARQAQTVQQQAELAFKAQMAKIQRENTVTELAQRLTGGSQDAPRGIRGVTAEDLQKHLLALPADEAKYFGDLLQGVVKDGLVEFAEIGHGRVVEGAKELPKEYADQLDSGAIKLAQLASPLLASDLGDLRQYNLSRWQNGGNGAGK